MNDVHELSWPAHKNPAALLGLSGWKTKEEALNVKSDGANDSVISHTSPLLVTFARTVESGVLYFLETSSCSVKCTCYYLTEVKT